MDSPRHVLLIEDDLDDIQFFCMVLKEMYPDIDIISHQHSDVALNNLAQGKVVMPDYIFLDLNMPKMNGWECLKSIRKLPVYENVSIVIYTTSSKEEDMKTAQRLGASHFLTKSFTLKEMRTTLMQFFSRGLQSE